MGRILGVVVGRGSGIGDRRSVRGTVEIRQSENRNLFETKLHNKCYNEPCVQRTL